MSNDDNLRLIRTGYMSNTIEMTFRDGTVQNWEGECALGVLDGYLVVNVSASDDYLESFMFPNDTIEKVYSSQSWATRDEVQNDSDLIEQ